MSGILSLETSFDAAHRLMHHQGKCFCTHGHRWRVIVKLHGTPEKKSGMILDFKEFKKQVNEVVELFDHVCILNNEDAALIKFLKSINNRVYEIAGEPTCENIAYTLKHLLYKKIPATLDVEVWESPTTGFQT